MDCVHSFYYETKGAATFGGDLYHSLTGSDPEGQEKAAQDKTKVNECFAIQVADVDGCHKKEKYSADEVVEILAIEVFTGADVFEEYGDLIGLASYPVGHMNALIGENDLVII